MSNHGTESQGLHWHGRFFGGETEKTTIPSPAPLLPELIVIQLLLLSAVQLHPLGTLTLTLPVPPALVKDWLRKELQAGLGAP